MFFGIAKFIDINVKKWPYISACAVFIALYSIFTFIYPNTRMRLVIFTIMIQPIFINTVYIILFMANKNHKKFALHVAYAHILLIGVHGTRGYIGLNNFAVYNYNFLAKREAILISISLLLMIYLAFSIIQMVYLKLLYQLDESVDHTKNLLRKTRYLAETDKLTKIFNRGKIEKIVQKEINNYNNFGHLFSVLMVDIDYFKRFNDRYGHDFGDQVIIQVVNILKNNLRDTDVIGRWGGEEFLIVLRNSNLETAKNVGNKLIDIVNKYTLKFNKINEKVTISIGCSEMKKSYNINSLIKSSDLALYRAKENGRNRLETSNK